MREGEECIIEIVKGVVIIVKSQEQHNVMLTQIANVATKPKLNFLYHFDTLSSTSVLKSKTRMHY